MFNCKTRYYPNGDVQVRLYSHPYVPVSQNAEYKDIEISPFGGSIKYQDFESALKAKEHSILNSLKRTKSNIYDIARSNRWDLFVTMTFNPEKVDRYDYAAVSKKFSAWLNRLKKKNKDIYYLFVPEMHLDGAWHFHGLLSNASEKDLKLVESG